MWDPACGAALSVLTESVVAGGPTFLAFDPAGLEHLLFECFPAELPLEPTKAAGHLAGLRSFYQFLLTEVEAPWARACLDVLGGDAATRFEAALADTSRYSDEKRHALALRRPRLPAPNLALRAEPARRGAADVAARRDAKRRRKAKRTARAKRR